MEINEFVLNLANQFEDTDASEITNKTAFKSLEEWSSLTALTIIAMCDEVYSVKVTGDDIRNSETVEDLFELIKSKK